MSCRSLVLVYLPVHQPLCPRWSHPCSWLSGITGSPRRAIDEVFLHQYYSRLVRVSWARDWKKISIVVYIVVHVGTTEFLDVSEICASAKKRYQATFLFWVERQGYQMQLEESNFRACSVIVISTQLSIRGLVCRCPWTNSNPNFRLYLLNWLQYGARATLWNPPVCFKASLQD